jgi:predicted nucleotidyltransferase
MYNEGKNKILLEVRSGSYLYGTNTPESDVDYQGVFLPPEEYILGLDRVEILDCSIISKNEKGTNNKDAIDRKFYEIRRFVELVLKGNPNIIELSFVNEENIIQITEFGKELLNTIPLLLGRKFINSFMGFILSEKKQYENVNNTTTYRNRKKAYRILLLIHEATQLIYNGRIQFPLDNSEFLTSVKLGLVPFNELEK